MEGYIFRGFGKIFLGIDGNGWTQINHLTVMVMLAWLSTPPMLTISGTAAPVVAVDGTTALICSSPGTEPGAAWAALIVAGWPPMGTGTGAMGGTGGEMGVRVFTPAERIAPAAVT